MQACTVIQLQAAAPGEVLSLCRIFAYEALDSTNAEALRLAGLGEPEGTVVLADAQTAGRGRRGRDWYSPPGKDIYLSILLRPQIQAEKISRLTLVAAAAVREAIEKSVRETLPEGIGPGSDPGQRYRIKWPNDITADGKKICGILTETRMDGMEIGAVVVGIGVNVNTDSFPEEIRDRATSLFCTEGRYFDRMQLAGTLLQCFAKDYAFFLKSGDLSSFTEIYNASMAGIDRPARVSGPGWENTGIIRGIDETGSLLLQTEDGRIEPVISGEVSLRAMDAYI